MSEIDACRSIDDEVKLQAFSNCPHLKSGAPGVRKTGFCAALRRSPWLQQRSQIRYVIILSLLAVLNWRIVSVGVYGGPTDQSPSSFFFCVCVCVFIFGVDAFRIYVHVWALGCFHNLSSSQNLSDDADIVSGQLRGNIEYPSVV